MTRPDSARDCPGYRSIINFGEDLPSRDIDMAFREHRVADLCLAMGSSLRVTPAADAPAECAARGGKLVIVNLQKTPLDSAASLVIRAFCDDVSKGVAERLGVTIPGFKLMRRVRVSVASAPDKARLGGAGKSSGRCLELCGLGLDDTPFALLTGGKAALLTAAGEALPEPLAVKGIAARSVPAAAATRGSASDGAVPAALRVALPDGAQAAGTALEVVCGFVGHYAEPPVRIVVPMDSLAAVAASPRVLELALVPGERAWQGDDLEAAPKRVSGASASATAAASACREPAAAAASAASLGPSRRPRPVARVAASRPVPGAVPAAVPAHRAVRRAAPAAAADGGIRAAARPAAGAPRAARPVPVGLTHAAMLTAHRDVASLAAEMKELDIN